MRLIGKVLVVFALAFVLAASAASPPPTSSTSSKDKRNRYKWTDAQGNLHYDDALPMEALQLGYDVVNGQGIVVKHVDRAKTAEELKAAKEAADKAVAAKRVSDAQAKNEQQLLAAYPNENDLVIAQRAQIDTIDQSIHATEVSLKNQEKSLSEMLSHAADLDRTGKPVPASLQHRSIPYASMSNIRRRTSPTSRRKKNLTRKSSRRNLYTIAKCRRASTHARP